MLNKKEIIDIVDRYWKFDEHQQHAASWHDKQDCLKELEAKLSDVILSIDMNLFKIEKGICDDCDAALWNGSKCTQYAEGECTLSENLIYKWKNKDI